MSDLCEETVERGIPRWPIFEPCGRIAVETVEGKRLCKVHVAVYRRRRERRDASRAKSEASDAAHERAKQALDELKKFGISAKIDYQHGNGSDLGRYTGKVIVDPDEVLAVLRGTS